jgi:glycosyltransferase involved in cell wall biosynthesis
MRIAQISPLDESVPPETYGGTERVVHYLTEELVTMGHDVTLFAAGDSQTSAKLAAVCPKSLRLAGQYLSRHVYLSLMLEELIRRRAEFDIAHIHIDYVHLSLVRRSDLPAVTTLHGRQDFQGIAGLYREFSETPLVSISNNQRKPIPVARWAGTVYHGLPRSIYPFSPKGGEYLAFLGRVSEEKGIAAAIAIAKQVGMKLRIAAKVDFDNEQYFREKIVQLLDHPLIEFIGEIGEDQKSDFLGGAAAVLFPISWPEPFGLVLIEAMACGTPVIAFRAGSVPEIIEDGKNGFIVRDIEEACDAVGRLNQISRLGCRSVFDKRFTARTMAKNYLRIYDSVLESQSAPFYRRQAFR